MPDMEWGRGEGRRGTKIEREAASRGFWILKAFQLQFQSICILAVSPFKWLLFLAMHI